ncbi:MAG: hypothetical protein J0I79_22720 [Mesorhizobium sp.]|nr:hypothetical protein [Mesorhizobium sp.]
MSFLDAFVKYSVAGFAFYVKPGAVVREMSERDANWYAIMTVAAVFAVAQQSTIYLDFLGHRGNSIPHFPILYKVISNLAIAVVASSVIFAFSRVMEAGADFKEICRGVILKFPIAVAFSLSILGIKYAVFGFLSLLPKETGMTIGWYLFALIAVVFGSLIKGLQVLSTYGVSSFSSIAIAVQIFLVSKRALRTNVLIAVAVTLAAAIACSAMAALIFFARYHSIYWKITLGALFS